MSDLEAYYRIFLAERLRRAQEKNPRYSVTAYARSLGISKSYASKLLAGKILLSLDIAKEISKKLKLSRQISQRFLVSVADEQKCHALYLIDPTLTDCDPKFHDLNQQPRSRRKKKSVN